MATKRFIKNLVKSFKNVVPDAIGETLPGAKSLVNFLKNPAGEGNTIKETFNEILGDYKEDYNKFTGIFKNAKKDIKSGNLYDPEAEQRAAMAAFGGEGFDFNFDSGKDDDIFGDSDWGDTDSSDNASEDVGGEAAPRNVTFVNNGSDLEGASIITGAMASGTARTVGAIEKGTAVNFAVMNSIDSRLSRIEESTNKFFASNLELLSSIKSNLEAMSKIKGAEETNLPVSQLERLFGDGSQEFNLRLYMRHLNSKVKDNDMYSMAKMFLPMLTVSTGFKELTKWGLRKIPFMGMLEKMSKMMEGYGQILLSQMSNVKGDGVISKLFRFFGVKTQADRGKVTLGKLNKGPISFDGETKEAITRAIPGYLAKILNIMQHGKNAKDDTMQIYDYDKRQYRTVADAKKELEEKESYNTGEIKNFIATCMQIAESSGATGEDLAKMKKQITDVVLNYAASGKSFADKDFAKNLSGKLKTIIGGAISEYQKDTNKVHSLEMARFSYASYLQTQQNESSAMQMAEHFKTVETKEETPNVLADYFEGRNYHYLRELFTKLFGADYDVDTLVKEYKADKKKAESNGPFSYFNVSEWIKGKLSEAQVKSLQDEIQRISDAKYGSAFSADIENNANIVPDVSNIDISKVEDVADLSNLSAKETEIAKAFQDFLINGPQRIASAGDVLSKRKYRQLKRFFRSAKDNVTDAFDDKLNGFAKGGYTGKGPVDEIAGPAHKGEYIMPSYVLKQRAGLDLAKKAENLRLSMLPGFAGGGYTDNTPDLGENDFFLSDEKYKNKAMAKRRKVYEELISYNVPFDDAIVVAKIADSDPDAAEKFIKRAKTDKLFADKGVAGAGHLLEDLGATFRNDVAVPFKDIFLGTVANIRNGKITAKDILGKAKEVMPGVAKYSGLGLAAGFFLPGGPLLGAITGGAIGALNQSEALRGYFFGSKDEQGKMKKRGLFPRLAGVFVKSIYGKEVGDKAEANTRSFFDNPLQAISNAWKDPTGKKMIIGSGIGAGILGSFFGPGGALLGALAGGAIGHKKQQGFFNKLMFGKRVVDKDGNVKGYTGGLWHSISGAFNAAIAGPAQAMLVGGSLKDYKDMMTGKLDPRKIQANLRKGLAHLGAGAAAGGLLGSFFGPGGTLVGALLGSTTGIRPVRAAAKRLMFGKEDENTHKRSGGIIGFTKGIITKAGTLASFIANGIDPKEHPVMSKIAGALGKMLGFTFKLPIKAAKGVSALLMPFRKFSASSHTLLQGNELVDAVLNDPNSSTADKYQAMKIGLLTADIRQIKEILTKKSKFEESEKAKKAADDDINSASEITQQNKEKAVEAAAKAEAEATAEHRETVQEGIADIAKKVEEGNSNTKGLLGTIASTVVGILPLLGGKSAMDFISKIPGASLVKGAGVAAIVGGGIMAAHGLYNSFKSENPDDKAEADDEAKNGAKLGFWGSLLTKAGGALKNAADGAWKTIKSVPGAAKEAVGKAVTKIKSVTEGISKLKDVVTKAFPRLLKLVWSQKSILKKVPLLGAFFVSVEAFTAGKKYYDTKDGTSLISPRMACICFVKDSAAAFTDLAMLIISGGLMATGAGAAVVGIMAIVDALLSFMSGNSIAEWIGEFVAKFLGGVIATYVFGWSEERDAAWRRGELEAYDAKMKGQPEDVKPVELDEPPPSLNGEEDKEFNLNEVKIKGNVGSVVGASVNTDPDRVQERVVRDSNLSAVKNSNMRSGELEMMGKKGTWSEVTEGNCTTRRVKIPGMVDQSYTTCVDPSIPGADNGFSPVNDKNIDIKQTISNPQDYLEVTGSDGWKTIDQLNPETKNDLFQMSKMYYDTYGEKLRVTSGKRDPNKQYDLWANINSDKREFAKWATGKGYNPDLIKTNFPGTSAHEVGNAIDIDNSNPRTISRMFGYSPSDPNMVVEGSGFRIKPDSIVGRYNALKQANGGKPIRRASGKFRPSKGDYNEHWHMQNITTAKDLENTWDESKSARVKAIDSLDEEIKKLSGGQQELSESIKEKYTAEDKGKNFRQLQPNKAATRNNATEKVNPNEKKGEAGDSDTSTGYNNRNEVTSSGNGNSEKIVALLSNILAAITNIGKKNDSQNDNASKMASDMLAKIFIPSSEAFNPNESALSLMGSRLTVGI